MMRDQSRIVDRVVKPANYIGISKFKERYLELLDNLDTQGLVITRHGRPVARVVPCTDSPGTLIGCLKGRVSVNGDLLSADQRWNANDQS